LVPPARSVSLLKVLQNVVSLRQNWREAMALPDTLPTLLNAEQVAEYLGLHKVTVLKFARAGKLPGLKVGREWRFQADDMRAWLAARQEERADSVARFTALLDRLGEGIRAAGYGPDDVEDLIAEVRRQHRAAPRA
jgi:excisionase family DNA binding protein